MKQVLISVFIITSCIALTYGQQNITITSNSAGNIRLGMTVASVRRAMKGYKLPRVSDGEGVALIKVSKGRNEVMTLYAGEDDRDAGINEKAKIEQIRIWDSRFKTKDGIHPNMLVKNAERVLGNTVRVFMSEIESREYVVFRRKPKGLMFRVGVNTEGKYLTAGIYKNGERRGTKCVPTAIIISIEVSDLFDSNTFK